MDRVMESFGWPMGPAHLQDVIGLDTAGHVYDIIVAGYPQRMSIAFKDPIHRLAEQGRFGQKNGAGFYRYEANAKGRPVKLTAPESHALLVDIQSRDRRTFEPIEITERMMLPMIIEAAVCLMDQVAETAADIDMSLILGLGFPRYLGGPLKYADRLGLRTVVDKCDRYGLLNQAGLVGTYLRKMAETGATFHG